MTVTLPARQAGQPAADSLRDLAERMDELQGYYVEIIEGALVVSPMPSKKHNGIVLAVQEQLLRELPKDKRPHPVSSVEGEDGSDDYGSPDLIGGSGGARLRGGMAISSARGPFRDGSRL